MVWDRAGSQRALAQEMPEGIAAVWLLWVSPELTPVEQVWEGLRRKLVDRVFESLEALEVAVWKALREYGEHLNALISLTGYG